MHLTCPIPSNHPQASTTSATIPITSRAIPSSHYPSRSPSPSLLDAPPTKRIRQCSNYGRAGHNHRSCKQADDD